MANDFDNQAELHVLASSELPDNIDDSEELEDIDNTEETIDPSTPVKEKATPSSVRPRAGQELLQLYMKEIDRFPILAPDEEFALARKIKENEDPEAAFRLVTSQLRLVVKIAMDFQRRWMQNLLDLIQEGNVGLIRAAHKYDPERGIRFSYYAAYWIKAYILKYIMENWRMVKIGTTQAQRKLFYNLGKERHRLASLGFDPSAKEISQSLGVSELEVMEMDQRLAMSDLSLNATFNDDSSASRMDLLPSLTPGVEEMLAQKEMAGLINKHLKDLLPKLNDKEKDLLQERLLSDSPLTLRELGERYGITRERVRQIETRLLEKLKKHFNENIGGFSADWANWVKVND